MSFWKVRGIPWHWLFLYQHSVHWPLLSQLTKCSVRWSFMEAETGKTVSTELHKNSVRRGLGIGNTCEEVRKQQMQSSSLLHRQGKGDGRSCKSRRLRGSVISFRSGSTGCCVLLVWISASRLLISLLRKPGKALTTQKCKSLFLLCFTSRTAFNIAWFAKCQAEIARVAGIKIIFIWKLKNQALAVKYRLQ